MDFSELVREYFPVIVSWLMGCGCAYSVLTSIKLARRDCGAKRMPNWLVRVLAFVFTLMITTLVAYKFFNMPYDVAMTHGLVAGLAYSLIMTVIMYFLQMYSEKLYNRIRVPSRRRATDLLPRDPNEETHPGFF